MYMGGFFLFALSVLAPQSIESVFYSHLKRRLAVLVLCGALGWRAS